MYQTLRPVPRVFSPHTFLRLPGPSRRQPVYSGSSLGPSHSCRPPVSFPYLRPSAAPLSLSLLVFSCLVRSRLLFSLDMDHSKGLLCDFHLRRSCVCMCMSSLPLQSCSWPCSGSRLLNSQAVHVRPRVPGVRERRVSRPHVRGPPRGPGPGRLWGKGPQTSLSERRQESTRSTYGSSVLFPDLPKRGEDLVTS